MPNAIEMLRQDHSKVKELFTKFEGAKDTQEIQRVVETALDELEVHAALEEEIFYPAVREEISEENKINEAEEEHHVVKLLISELEGMRSSDDRYRAKFKVLAESVKHHIQEEEGKMFPEIERSLDFEELGEQMMERKQQLQEEIVSGTSAPKRTKRATGRSRPARGTQARGSQSRTRKRKKTVRHR
jgi:hemerythrin superfamily protein